MQVLADFLATPKPDGSKRRKRDFAREIGVVQTMVTEYAQGRAWPGLERWEAIVKASGGRVHPSACLSPEAQRLIADAAQ